MPTITFRIDPITITAVTEPDHAPPPHGTLRWHVGPMLTQGDAMPIEVSLTTEQQVRLSITPTTPAGAPAPIDGPATWTLQGSGAVVPIDQTSCWYKAAAPVGDAVVTVQADADMGAGVVTLADTATMHVQTPMATQLGMAAEQPVLQTP
jgi:hypothetical protein